MDAAAAALLECDTAGRALAPQTRRLNAKSSAAKAAIVQHMLASKMRYQQLGQNKFVVLKKSVKKPSRSNELLSVVAQKWCAETMGKELSEDEGIAFLTTLENAERSLSETTWTCAVTSAKPVASLLQ
jgi:hypothetical protein